jgi:hypothetical protein
MPLTGQAKTDYQRTYMRTRRAAQALANPKPPREPSKATIRRREREHRQKEAEAEKKAPPSCWFCSEPMSDSRVMVCGNGLYICEECIARAVEIIAETKRERAQGADQASPDS